MKTKFLFLFIIASQLIFAQMDDKFYQPSKVMKPSENVNYSEFKIPVEKDTITGIFLKPKSIAKATILFFHGAGGNVSTYTFMTKPLVEDGFQVLMVDLRGYGKSTGIPTHQTIASDAQVFFDYAKSLKEVKNKPIIVYGASMGTQVATNLAKNNQDKITGLVLDGPLSSLNEIAAYYAPQMKDFVLKMKFADYSAQEDIKTIKVPKVIIHSKEDKEVPFEQGKTVFDNAIEPKKMVVYTGNHLEGILNSKPEILKEINNLISK